MKQSSVSFQSAVRNRTFVVVSVAVWRIKPFHCSSRGGSESSHEGYNDFQGGCFCDVDPVMHSTAPLQPF